MNHGIVSLARILPGYGLPEPKPKEDRAPIPKPPKVVGDPTRTPANRQAALVIAPASWINKPMPPEVKVVPPIDLLREENAKLKAANANLVAENCALRKRVERLTKLTTTKPIPQQQPTPQPTENTIARKRQILEALNGGR